MAFDLFAFKQAESVLMLKEGIINRARYIIMHSAFASNELVKKHLNTKAIFYNQAQQIHNT